MSFAKSQPFLHPLADVQTLAIGAGTRVWQFVVVLPGAKIGADCNICSHCLFENDVVIGVSVAVKRGVQLWDGLRAGNYVFIGPNTSLANDRLPRSELYLAHFSQTTVLISASIVRRDCDVAKNEDRRTRHERRWSVRHALGARWCHRGGRFCAHRRVLGRQP